MVATWTSDRPDTSREHDARVVRSRARILAAATELLVEAGPRAVTVDAVAERSGVAKSTMYRHWPSRTDLLVDVVRQHVPELPAVDPAAGFEASLRSVIGAVAATLTSPEWARIMPALLSLHFHMPEMAELLADDHGAKEAVIGAVLELGAAEGLVPAGLDPHRVSQLLIGPLVFATINGDHTDIGPLAADVVDRFLASYRSTPPTKGTPT
jgi:AcrR family transcriptional regulator